VTTPYVYLSLLHSPAEIMRAALVSMGLCLSPVSVQAEPTGTVWPAYATNEPSSPDSVVTCYDTADVGHGRDMITGERTSHRGVQIRVRSQYYAAGFKQAQNLAINTDENIWQMQVSITTAAGTATYIIWNVSRTSQVIPIGRDTPRTQRRIFTINTLMAVTRIA
jgi:hypothetical protein